MWYRFIIHVWVKDGTGEAYFMLLDWIAIGVVPDSAAALLNGSFDEVITCISQLHYILSQYTTLNIRWILQLKDIDSFPEAITTLVGKTFMFGVHIESKNIASKGGMYKVGKVWRDLSMLLTGGISTESWTQSDVGTTNLSCSQVWFSIFRFID